MKLFIKIGVGVSVALNLFVFTVAMYGLYTREARIEESHWNYVYDAIEYIKAGQIEKKMTDPSDVINNALMEFNNGSNGSTKQKELLQLPSDGD